MAVRDGLIRTNPSDGVMAEIKKSKLWDGPKRHALTIPEQQAFMNFLEKDREYEGWLPVITVLLGTGLRIGECKKHIQTPKTEAGTRSIPMIDDVFEAFLTEYEIQKCLGFCEEEIDGYSRFFFSTSQLMQILDDRYGLAPKREEAKRHRLTYTTNLRQIYDHL